MGKKLATKLADKGSEPGNLNALAMLVTPEMMEQARLERERAEAECLEREKQDAAYQAHCYRWLERIERWAMKQSRDELAERFPLALLLLIETRKTSRSRDDLANRWKELAEDASDRAKAAQAVAVDSIRKELMQTAARRKGIVRKLANDPKQAAKVEAHKLWQDWQSGKTLHKSGAAFARHVVDLTVIEDTGTVQRWMRSWRET